MSIPCPSCTFESDPGSTECELCHEPLIATSKHDIQQIQVSQNSMNNAIEDVIDLLSDSDDSLPSAAPMQSQRSMEIENDVVELDSESDTLMQQDSQGFPESRMDFSFEVPSEEESIVVLSQSKETSILEEPLLRENSSAIPKDVSFLSKSDQRLFRSMNDKRKQGMFAFNQMIVHVSRNILEERHFKPIVEIARVKLEEHGVIIQSTLLTNSKITWEFLHVSEDLHLSCFRDDRMYVDKNMDEVDPVICTFQLYVFHASAILQMKKEGKLSDFVDGIMKQPMPWRKSSVTFAISGLQSAIQYDLHHAHRPGSQSSGTRGYHSLMEAENEFLKFYIKYQGKFRFRFFNSSKSCGEYIWSITKNLANYYYAPEPDPRRFCKSVSTSTVGGTTAYKEWFNFLLQFPGVSQLRAEAIIREFPCFRALMDAYDACRDDKERAKVLADVKISDNGTRLGPKLSLTIFQYLFGR